MSSTTIAIADNNNHKTTLPKQQLPVRSEADVYDRQIRLWGADAQAKMSQANVLYIHVTGVSSEILKNMVLAGIRATLCDTRSLHEALTTPSFFYNAEELIKQQSKSKESKETTEEEEANAHTHAKKRAKYSTSTVAEVVQPQIEDLNPLLGACSVIHKSVDALTADDVAGYSIIVASRVTMKQAIRLSAYITAQGGALYHVDTFGLYGACAMDLGAHRMYRPEKGKDLLQATRLAQPHVPLQTLYQVPLEHATNRFHKQGPPEPYGVWRALLEYVEMKNAWPTEASSDLFVAHTQAWIAQTSPSYRTHAMFTSAHLKRIANIATHEIAPVCAVLGGLVGNEIIKIISGKGEPANNTILFEGISCKAYTFLVESNRKIQQPSD